VTQVSRGSGRRHPWLRTEQGKPRGRFYSSWHHFHALAVGTGRYTSATPSIGDRVAMPDRPRLCTLCEGISLNALTSYTGYPHHASYQALESSARRCSLCNLLTCALKQCEGVSEVIQRESSQQISIGACDGGYVGLGIDTNLTDLDIHVGQERYARLQLFAAAGRPSLPRVLT
jgi:hypothetical protein